jgi:hypothetical protein
MDPTKSFDHLDPKLKETYVRVMGTDTNKSNNTTQISADQTAQNISATPTTFDPNQPLTDSNLNSPSPLSSGLNQSATDAGPNPGTGPTIGTSDPNTMFSTPLNTPAATESVPDPNAPATSSFFSNPSPATTDPTPSASTPIGPPVTPYAPEGLTAGQAPAADGSYTQPLPSPSSVNQGAHEASPLLKVLYIIGAVIFFAVYTIFWIKVFNLPFLF